MRRHEKYILHSWRYAWAQHVRTAMHLLVGFDDIKSSTEHIRRENAQLTRLLIWQPRTSNVAEWFRKKYFVETTISHENIRNRRCRLPRRTIPQRHAKNLSDEKSGKPWTNMQRLCVASRKTRDEVTDVSSKLKLLFQQAAWKSRCQKTHTAD